MDPARLIILSDQVRQLKSDANADCSEMLLSELEATNSDEEKTAIYGMLAAELQGQSRFEEAESAIRELIALTPQMPDGWIKLALHFLYYGKDLMLARSAINKALEKASKEGNFVRQAHLERIRIALALKDYQLVENSLVELINYEPRHGSVDVQLESEFLAWTPAGAVNERIMLDYRAKVIADLQKSQG